MFRFDSIKAKLQAWVVVIFVLTGTAGWGGIWGLLYISRTTREMSTEQMQKVEDATKIQAELSEARRIDERYWLSVAAADPAKQKEQRQKLAGAWASVGQRIKQIRNNAAQGAGAFDAMETAHGQVMLAWSAVESSAGKPFAEQEDGVYADYERAVVELDKQVWAITGSAFGSVKAQTNQLYNWIWILQIALFATVAACQGFSAWAGWRLSRILTGELFALKEAAEKISLGDLKTEVKVATSDAEIVAVGEALDRLRVSLAKAMDRLAARRGASTPPKPTES